MGFALLLLGLLPLAFMPDFLGHEAEPEDEPANDPLGGGGDGGGLDASVGTEQAAGVDLISDLPGVGGGGAMDPGAAQAALDHTDGSGEQDVDVDQAQDQPNGENILQPVNDVDQPDAGTQDVNQGDVLHPIDQIDVSSGQDVPDGTVLMPVNPIDTGLPTDGDSGGDTDAIWVNFDDDAGTGHALIDDFTPGVDVLHISLSSDAVTGIPAVQVTASADGQDGLVFVEKQMIAVLRGAVGATADDIKVDVGLDPID